MIKYAKFIDEEKGTVEVGIGTNVEFYQSIGMVEMDVEQSDVDGLWYLTEKCPHKSEEEKAREREEYFKSKFFEVPNFGWYRKQPKGYQSAVESMNVLFNIANVAQGIQAGLIIFYQEPDFTKPEECTEEWLIEHQVVQGAMTLQQFMALYVEFMTAWNREEHQSLTGEE